MPDKDFSDRLRLVLRKEADRIGKLADPVEREHEAREFQRLLTPMLTDLRVLRSNAIAQVLAEDEAMTLRDLSLVMGLSFQQIHRLRDGADDLDAEALAG